MICSMARTVSSEQYYIFGALPKVPHFFCKISILLKLFCLQCSNENRAPYSFYTEIAITSNLYPTYLGPWRPNSPILTRQKILNRLHASLLHDYNHSSKGRIIVPQIRCFFSRKNFTLQQVPDTFWKTFIFFRKILTFLNLASCYIEYNISLSIFELSF